MQKGFIYLLILTAFMACNNASEKSASTYDINRATEPGSSSEGLTTDETDASKAEAPSSESTATDQTKTDLTASAPKLIKNGYLTVEVKDYAAYRKSVQDLVKQHGGYLGNETEANETYRISNDLIIRVPAKSFDIIMNGLMSNTIKIDSKRIEVQDVGEEYADLQARILTKQAVEKRYLDILNKAGKITDILEVEEKLRVIREEIEAAQGRVKYLESQVSFSTINLNFYKVLDAHYTPPSGPGFFSRIWSGLVKGWENILDIIIGLVYLWPLWAIIFIVILIIRRKKISFRIWPFRKKEL
jgi:hypothetical protein